MRGGAGPKGTARARALKVTAAPLSSSAPTAKSYPRSPREPLGRCVPGPAVSAAISAPQENRGL